MSALDEQDPTTGRTPLATAAVAGSVDMVQQLLNRGAKADARSRDNSTPLLLATRETSSNRARILQLLLSKTPPSSIDATTAADDNNTPLMYAVLKRDAQSTRLLARAGASLQATNNSGQTAQTMAKATSNQALVRALVPEKVLAELTDTVNSFLLYIVAWVNKTADGLMRELFGLNPELNNDTDEKVNYGETPNKAEFLENIGDFVRNSPSLERFFKDKPTYIQELAKKATELEKDPTTPDLLPKVIKITLHQQVIYCDDSSSMKREGRWDAQVQLIKRITRITTRILPDGDGVALRFINQNVNNSDKLSLQQIGNIMQGMSWEPNGDTAIGTFLKSKVLEPMVYSKLQPRSLERPLLISVITDGMPSQENDEAFVEVIKECGVKLQQAGYPRGSVKFMVGQIGTGKQAARFLQGVGNDRDIEEMVFVTSDQLDERLLAFKEREDDLDRWLIETLFQPIRNKD